MVRDAYPTATTNRYSYDDLGREIKRKFYDVGGAQVWTRVAIDKVETGSKSQRGGLQAGDVLLSYDGEEVADVRVFNELELVKGERPRELTVQRDGKVLSLHVPGGRLTGIETVDKVPGEPGTARYPHKSATVAEPRWIPPCSRSTEARKREPGAPVASSNAANDSVAKTEPSAVQASMRAARLTLEPENPSFPWIGS